MTFTLTFTLTLLCAAGTWRAARGQTPNTYDEATHKIHFGELAPDAPYKTVDYEADDGGLDPYFGLAKSFIDSSLPEELPIDTVKDILDGKKTIGDEWQKLAKAFVGFSLCIVIGLLFFFIFPIVALCFCCCRCCGNCGGKRIQKVPEDGPCKRTVFAIILGILSLFVMAGAACAFVSSDQISKNLGGLNSSFSDAVDDFITFADNIGNQFTRLGGTNFNYTADIVDSYVKGVSDEVSERVITDVNALVGLDAPLDKLSTLTNTTVEEIDKLDQKATLLETQRVQALSDLNTWHSACSCLTPRIAFMNGFQATITALQGNLGTFRTKASTDVFGKMKDDIAGQIKTEVEKGTSSIDVKSKMDDIYSSQMKGMLDQVDTFKDTIRGDSQSYQNKVEDFTDTAKPYDKYRWYAGLGLAVFPLLISVLMLLGIFLGVCCGSASTPPTERGGGSNCGGICLMSAVGLIFIFSAFLMLLTTVMYMVGSITERYVCQSIDNLARIEKYANDFDLGTDLTNISFPVNGELVTATISKVMSDCENGKTIYTAFGLKTVVDAALNLIENYKNQDLDFTSGIDMSAAANALTGVDVTAETASLQGTQTELSTLSTAIMSMKSALQSEKTQAQSQDQSYGAAYDPMLTTVDEMKAITDSLASVVADIVTEANKLGPLVSQAVTKLQDSSTMTTIVDGATKDFVNTIGGFMDSYVSDIRIKLETSVAKCTPLYSVTNAILGEAFCHGIVDPLNGFWLALGWCIFFFMPSLIFAVKLAKFYRTMLYADSYGSPIECETKNHVGELKEWHKQGSDFAVGLKKTHTIHVCNMATNENDALEQAFENEEDSGPGAKQAQAMEMYAQPPHNKVAPF